MPKYPPQPPASRRHVRLWFPERKFMGATADAFAPHSLSLEDDIQSGRAIPLWSTGLVDRAAKEVMEGDIVKLDRGPMVRIVWHDVYARWMALQPNGDSAMLCNVRKGHILGNVHQNPTLFPPAV